MEEKKLEGAKGFMILFTDEGFQIIPEIPEEGKVTEKVSWDEVEWTCAKVVQNIREMRFSSMISQSIDQKLGMGIMNNIMAGQQANSINKKLKLV